MSDSYERAGVASQKDALTAVARHLAPTLSLPDTGEVITSFGHYASVIKLSDELAVAVCTDGVGSKTIVASALSRFDTIGFDCVAMNVNDLICVGARPLALVDYIGVHALDSDMVEALLEGIGAAAKEAGIAVPGGEVAQLPDVIGSADERTAFDLVGTCIGTGHPDELILGDAISEGDQLIGIASTGIHSNGLTLARRLLLEGAKLTLDEHIGELGRTLGEELLEPTDIYVRPVLELWNANVPISGLAHITGDGLANLCRLRSDVGFVIDDLPPRPAVFDLIQRAGELPDEEMFSVFNMGVGFVVIVPPEHVERAVEVIESTARRAARIGEVTSTPGCVEIEAAGVTLERP